MVEEFKILGIRKTREGDIKGYVDLEVGPITILGIKIIEGGGKTFCAMPSENFYSQSAGKMLNRALVHLEGDLRAMVYAEILKKWNELEELKFNGKVGDEK